MKRILITLLLAAAAVAAVVLWRGWPHLFPSSDTDDLYRRYEHNDYVRATELHNFPVNDTLATDALLLEAATDSAWCELLLDFGVPEEMIEMYKSNKEFFISNENSSLLLFYMDRNNPSDRLPPSHPDSKLVIASFKKQSMSVFLTDNPDLKDIISFNEIKKMKKHEKED